MPSKAKITIIKRNGMFQVSNVFLPDELYVRFSSHEAIAHVANDIFVEDRKSIIGILVKNSLGCYVVNYYKLPRLF
jgi:hypothetical protein